MIAANRLGRLCSGLLLLAVSVAWAGTSPPAEPSVPPGADRHPTGGDFTLDSAAGPVSLFDFRGKVVLLFFGYTRCPDVCPTALFSMAKALKMLSAEELGEVTALFVSLDPERDTPGQLADYVKYFHPKLMGLTGSPSAVRQVASLYGVAYRQVKLGDGGDYGIEHSAESYLIDRSGSLRYVFPYRTASNMVAEGIRLVLREAPEPRSDPAARR